MISFRLPEDVELELNKLAEYKHTTKSEILKEAVVDYLAKEKVVQSSYEAGKTFFGKHESKMDDLSVNYKKKLREKYEKKHSG